MSQLPQTLWERLIEFLQENPTFTRKEVFRKLNADDSKRHTLDSYFTYLNRAKYTCIMDKKTANSHFVVLKPVPPGLKQKELLIQIEYKTPHSYATGPSPRKILTDKKIGIVKECVDKGLGPKVAMERLDVKKFVISRWREESEIFEALWSKLLRPKGHFKPTRSIYDLALQRKVKTYDCVA